MFRAIVSIVIMMILITMIGFSADSKEAPSKVEAKKDSCCSTCKTSANVTVNNLSMLNLEELGNGKVWNIDLTKENSLIVLLDKQSIKDYNQVVNFENWVNEKKLNLKIYTIIKTSSKEEAKKLAESNKVDKSLWDSGNVFNKNSYPIAYYFVNGKLIGETDKVTVGHLRKLTYCEECGKLEGTKGCCSTGKHKENHKENTKEDKSSVKKDDSKKDKCDKEGCCGGNCQCGSNCKCGK